MTRHLITLHTRTPLHVGCGHSVDVVDLPIARERITGFPIIPASGLKGPLLQAGREKWKSGADTKGKEVLAPQNQILFGTIIEEESADDSSGGEKRTKHTGHAGCVQILEAKLLAFPVRSLAGCFGWITCPAALQRFHRDTCKVAQTANGQTTPLAINEPPLDTAFLAPGSALKLQGQDKVVLEEYAFGSNTGDASFNAIAGVLKELSDDELWKRSLTSRLAILRDEDFQHFVTTTTEVVTRVGIDPATRSVKTGALFNQENVPCEALFYSVLTVLPVRFKSPPNTGGKSADDLLAELLPNGHILQIGGDETTGHGFCALKRIGLPTASAPTT